MTDYYWGVDMGKTGAIAVVGTKGAGEILEAFNFPLLKVQIGNRKGKSEVLDTAAFCHEMERLLKTYPPVVAIGEKVAANGNNGAIANFDMGFSFAMVQTTFFMLNIPFELVAPQKWKKNHGIPAGSDKNPSIIRAQQLYPGSWEKLCPEHKSIPGKLNSPNPDRAEAVLIARWGIDQRVKGAA